MIAVGESKDTAIVKEQLLKCLDQRFGVTSRTRSRVFLKSGKEVLLKYSKKHGPKGDKFWYGIVPNELQWHSPENAFILLALGSDREYALWPVSVASKVLRPELRSPDGQWKINIELRSGHVILHIGKEKVNLDEYIRANGMLGDGITDRIERLEAELKPDSGKSEEPDHNNIRDLIKEIGEMENYYSETEYRFDHMILDTVWKRTKNSVPAVAFEVQIGGSYVEALSKLKHSWDKFNSKPILVTTEKYEKKVDDLLDGSFHEIREQIRILNWKVIAELYEAEKRITSLRVQLEL